MIGDRYTHICFLFHPVLPNVIITLSKNISSRPESTKGSSRAVKQHKCMNERLRLENSTEYGILAQKPQKYAKLAPVLHLVLRSGDLSMHVQGGGLLRGIIAR